MHVLTCALHMHVFCLHTGFCSCCFHLPRDLRVFTVSARNAFFLTPSKSPQKILGPSSTLLRAQPRWVGMPHTNHHQCLPRYNNAGVGAGHRSSGTESTKCWLYRPMRTRWLRSTTPAVGSSWPAGEQATDYPTTEQIHDHSLCIPIRCVYLKCNIA